MRVLVRLFPRRFRERYGTELVELLDTSESTWRDGADLLRSALSLHVDNALGALRRWARTQRNLLLTLALAAGAGATLGACTGLGADLAIAGCSMLGGAVTSGACVLAVAGRQRVGRVLLPRAGS